MIESEKKHLTKILNNYLDLNRKVLEEKTINDLELYADLRKKIKTIEVLATTFRMYLTKEKELKEWKIITKTSNNFDEGFKEINRLEEELKVLYQQIQKIKKQSNKEDKNNTIVEIRGAAGGKEANLFAKNLFDMYTNFCKNKSWSYEIWETNKTEGGGYSLIIFLIKNKEAYSLLKYEAGVHRVQRIPKTESMGRVHTSTATVAILTEKIVDDFSINNQEIRIDTFRSSGAGGQHVNTTDSAVRITHLPTGIAVSCQEGRSQHDNKEKALNILKIRLFQQKQTNLEKERIGSRNKQIGEGERSEKIRTYNFLQNRVTDHRISWTYKNIEQIFNGKLGILLDKLTLLNSSWSCEKTKK